MTRNVLQLLDARSFLTLFVLLLLVSFAPAVTSAVEDVPPIYGCTDPTADNYDPAAETDDGSCVYTLIPGCTDPAADNYDPAAEEDDGTCDYGPTEVDVEITKAISGETLGFELSDFSYQVTGNGVDTTVPHGGTVALSVGTYTIEELVPAGFVKEDWRIGWYGQCDAGSAYSTTITVTESNVDHGILYCQADNQYRPAEYPGCTDSLATNYNSLATLDDDSCEYPDTPDYGCTDQTALNYDADALYDNGSCVYEIFGCTDVEAINYNPEATTDDQSCEYYVEPTYQVYGYVWHDKNENDVWDVEQDNPEDDESDLDGWTVTITNGETTLSVVTDENGYYEFYVPAGTWTITEEMQDQWTVTYPDNGQHVVDVLDTSVDEVVDELTLLDQVANFLMPVAFAQTAPTFGPLNFGNNTNGGGSSGGGGGGGVSSGGGGGGGGGGTRRTSCQSFDAVVAGGDVTFTWSTVRGDSLSITADGTEVFSSTVEAVVDGDTVTQAHTGASTFELTVTRGSRSDTCEVALASGGSGGGAPIAQVLGDQVSVVPQGGAHAGAGGAAPVEIPRLPLVAALSGALRRNG